jgi:hypothetical protein
MSSGGSSKSKSAVFKMGNRLTLASEKSAKWPVLQGFFREGRKMRFF